MSTKINYGMLPKYVTDDDSQIIHIKTVDKVGDDKSLICTLSDRDVLPFSTIDPNKNEIIFHNYIDNISDVLDVSTNSYNYETCVLTTAVIHSI